MAAGYKTANPVFVDNKMLQLPYQMMGDVLLKQEADFEEATVKPMAAFDDKLTIDAVPRDTEQANKLVSYYEDKAVERTRDLMEDPLDYKRKLYKIRNLEKELSTDMQRGKWGAIESRYKGYKNDAERIRELEAKDGYSDDYKSKLLANQLREAEKLKYNSDGTYNKYNNANATAMPNLNEWVDEVLTDAMPDLESIKRDTFNGGWIVTTKGVEKEMSEGKLASILNSSLEADVGLRDALEQRGILGMEEFSDLIGEGNSLKPAVGTNMIKQKTEDGEEIERNQLAFSNNILGSAFKAGVNKFGFSETEQSRSLKTNSYDLQNNAFEIYKKKEKFKDERNSEFIEFTFDNKIDSFTGGTIEEFNERREDTEVLLNDVIQKAVSTLERKLGEKLSPEEKEAVQNGEFDLLLEQGISENIVNKYASQYRQQYVRKMALQGAESTWEHQIFDEWKKEHGEEEISFDDYLENNKPRFNTYLNNNDNFVVSTSYGWEGMGLTNDQADNIQKQIKDSQLFKLGEFELNGEKTTISKLIDDNVLLPNQEKIGFRTTDPRYEELQNLLSMPEEERSEKGLAERYMNLMSANDIEPNSISYKFADGSGFINFEANESSFAPASSYDNDGDIDIGFTLNINGKPKVGKISTETLTTNGIEEFKNIDGENLQFNHYITKIQNQTDFTVDHMPGFVLDVKNKEVKIPNGDVYSLTKNAGRSVAKQMLLFNLY